MSCYFLCPVRYKFRYADGQRMPGTATLWRGRGYHKGAETNFNQKVVSHEDMSVDDIVDVSVAALDDVTSGREEMTLSDDERSQGKRKVMKRLVDEVAEMAELLAKEQAPRYQPIGVEEEFRITMKGMPDIVGRLDIRVHDGVIDFKSSGRRMSQLEADSSIQLTLYDIAHTGIAGEKASTLAYDRAVLTKSKAFTEVIATERNSQHVRALAERFTVMNRSIEAGIFIPCDPNAWQCSPKWCEFWKVCPYVAGERSLYQLEP